MNRIELIGRLTKEIELKRTQSGKTVANFTLAVNRPFARKDSEQQTADFFRCQAWERTAEILDQFTRKGSQIGISGRLQSRNYENQQGQRTTVIEVIVEHLDLLDSQKEAAESRVAGQSNYSQRSSAFQYDRNVRPSENPYVPADEYGIDADDLPF